MWWCPDGLLNMSQIPTGGIYTLPSFLSAGPRQLISSMLVVDPVKRATIAEIRNLEWFNIGLPEYLQPVPLELMDHPDPVDKAIIEELVRVGLARLAGSCVSLGRSRRLHSHRK